MSDTLKELEAIKAIKMDAGEVFSGRKSGCKIVGYEKPISFTSEVDKNYIFHSSSRDACSAPVPKEEFETDAERWKRIFDIEIKAYKEFKKSGIADKIYELDYSNRRSSELEYSVQKKILYYGSVIDALRGIGYRYKFISKNSRSIQSAVINFAGALKKYGHAYAGFMAIDCSVAEARKLKHNLGNNWKYRKMKLWLKFNLNEREWDIIKVFILPNTK